MASEEYKLRRKQAVNKFGLDIVEQVEEIVEENDPDIAHTAFEDEGMLQHMLCVEFLYFNE